MKMEKESYQCKYYLFKQIERKTMQMVISKLKNDLKQHISGGWKRRDVKKKWWSKILIKEI